MWLVPGYKSRSPVAAARSVTANEKMSDEVVGGAPVGDFNAAGESSSGAANGGVNADPGAGEDVAEEVSCAEEKSA